MKKRELDLNKLFKAKSIAVLGVSNDRKKLGRIVYDNLKKSQFQGSVFAVNNRGLKIAKEKTYLSLSEIPEKIDLLIIAIPAIFVKDALLEAVRLKIGAVVLISAGFKESGKLDLENEIMQIAKKHKLALLGPNCLGFLNPYLKINASFFDAKLKPGKIAFLSQSGALGSVILDQAKELLLGFSLFVSSGNRAVLDEADFLNYLSHDKNTEILAIYAEALKETKRLIPAIQNFNKEKKRPIIVLKSGTSPLGAKASLSHTGALAGKDAIYQAFFQDQSLLRAKNLEELFDLLQIFNHNKHEKLKNTLILSNAGGPAVLAVDEAFRENLSLAKLSPGLKRSLAKILPSSASINNPLDILGDADPERLSAALDLLALEKDIDSLLIIISPQSMTNPSLMAQKIVEFRESYKKAIAVSFMGASLVKEARAILREAQIAHYDQVERAIKALAGLARFSGGIKQENLFPKSNFKKPEFPRKKERAKLILEEIKSQEIKELVEYRSLEFLKAYGFKLPSYYLLENETQAKKVLQKLKGNLAFKIASDDLLHKSDFNAVLLNVPGSKAFQAYKKFRKEFRDKYPEFSLKGVLVMPMHKEPQLELMLGVVSDPGLGKGLLLGLGGIYAEALSDSAMISLPLNAKNLLRLFNSLKASKILAGARAKTPIDLRSLISLAYQIEALIQDFPEIKEIEFNPIFTYEKEIQILDARIILE